MKRSTLDQIRSEERDARRRLREACASITRHAQVLSRAERRTAQAIALGVSEFSRCHDCGDPCVGARCAKHQEAHKVALGQAMT